MPQSSCLSCQASVAEPPATPSRCSQPPPRLRTCAELPQLREIDISHNELTALPADMSCFATLERLNCDHNRLGSEANFLSLCSAPQLRSLSLAHNLARRLPQSACECGFRELTALSLAHNQIKEVKKIA